LRPKRQARMRSGGEIEERSKFEAKSATVRKNGRRCTHRSKRSMSPIPQTDQWASTKRQWRPTDDGFALERAIGTGHLALRRAGQSTSGPNRQMRAKSKVDPDCVRTPNAASRGRPRTRTGRPDSRRKLLRKQVLSSSSQTPMATLSKSNAALTVQGWPVRGCLFLRGGGT
jgi:hypothetical protein